MYQTTVQDSNAIRFGSAKFEVGEDISSLVNLGAMRGIQFEETWEKIRVMSDNAGEIDVGIRNHMAAIQGDLMEINLTNLNIIRGGLDTYSTQSASSQSVTDEEISLSDTDAERFEFKNGDGSEVSSIVVQDDTDTTTYVRNTDYVISVDAQGYTTIARISSGGITSGDTLHVDYDYTPNASKTLKTGGNLTLNSRVVRITNTNAAGKNFRITIYKGTAEEGINIELPEDEGEDPAMTTVRIAGKIDPTRTVGEQLFEIYDEQGA